MKLKMLIASVCLIGGTMFFLGNGALAGSSESGLKMANVEALTKSESGAKCPNGCSSINPDGYNKILQCDCEYSLHSDCDRWGC